MKTIIAGAALWLLLIPGGAFAVWDTGGNNVTQQVVKRFDHYPKLAPDGQKGAYLAWDTEDDLGGDDFDVALCRLSPAGDVLWTVSVSAQNGVQEGAEVVSDGAGGAIVVWSDYRTTGLGEGIYAQRYDSLGVAQWISDGVFVSDRQPLLAASGERMHLVSDGNAGSFVVWQDSGQSIWAIRVGNDGYLPWGALAIGVTTTQDGGDYACDAASDGQGGLVVAWTAFDVTDRDVRAQRFNAAGTRMWGSDGVLVKGGDDDEQSLPEIVSTASGDAIVVWIDFSYAAGMEGVRAQRLDANGNPMWDPAGVPVSTPQVDVLIRSAELVGDGANGAFVLWYDNRAEYSASDIFAAHVDGTGGAGAEVPITAAESRAQDLVAVSDGNGGVFATWRLHDSIYGPAVEAVHCQWLNSSLSNVFKSGGALVYDNTAAQLYPQVVLASPGQFILVWEDERDQPAFNDCYALLVEGNTLPGPNVMLSPVDLTTGTTPVTVTFSDVTSQGETSLTTSPVGPPLPGTFTISGTYYHITTTATFSGLIEICITDSIVVPILDGDYNILHYDGSDWVNVTSSVDMFQHRICGVVTSLSPFVVGSGAFPDAAGSGRHRFSLHANVPNPFNPATTIRYSVPPGGAHVEIAVFDVAGRLVRSLVDERRAGGDWLVQWNGDDQRGRRAASGVYFYRMRAGTFSETRKMVLLK